MHARHKYILDAINNGARFVERVQGSSTYTLEWLDGKKESVSQDVYFTMKEKGYIQEKWRDFKKERFGTVTYRYYVDARGK